MKWLIVGLAMLWAVLAVQAMLRHQAAKRKRRDDQ